MRIIINPGQHLDIEVRGLGVLYTIIASERAYDDEVFVEMVDVKDATVLHQSSHSLAVEETPCPHSWIELTAAEKCEYCGLAYGDWSE